MDMIKHCKVVCVQSESMLCHEVTFDPLPGGLGQPGTRRNCLVCVKKCFHGGVLIEPFGPGPGKQERKERGSIVCHFEDRLVHQVLQKILAPNVDDERNGGVHGRDIRKVLFGSHTKIDAAWHHSLFQLRENNLKIGLIGYQVLGWKYAAFLRHFIHEPPEYLIVELLRNFSQRAFRANDDHNTEEQECSDQLLIKAEIHDHCHSRDSVELVFGRWFDMIDHDHRNQHLLRLQLEPELFFDSVQ